MCGRWVAEGAKVVFGDILDEEGRRWPAELADAAATSISTLPNPRNGRLRWTPVTALGGCVLVPALNIGTIEDYALTEWQRILDVNLTGVFLGIHAVKPMKETVKPSSTFRRSGWPARLLVIHTATSSPCGGC